MGTQIKNPQMGSETAQARWEGEHLECSPCGTVACPHGGVALMALAGPEVLLSLLPEEMDYTRGRRAVLGRKALQTSSRVSM